MMMRCTKRSFKKPLLSNDNRHCTTKSVDPMRYLTYQFHEYRQRRQAAHRWRQLQLSDWANCSFHRNDYLGLSQHPQVIAAFAQGLADYGCGSGEDRKSTRLNSSHVRISYIYTLSLHDALPIFDPMRYLTYQFHEYRQRRQAAHRWRQLQLSDWANCSFHRNDYLGLSQHPQVIAAFAQGLADYGCGSGGSPLIYGYQQPHHNLVRQLAEWLERDTAVLFSSGFAANQSALKALGALYDQLLLDRLCHASLLEGLGRRNWRRFPHNDVKAVRRLLKPGANLVITESVFSMDGDYAPLAELALLPTDLWVDDAHGIGLLGPDGRGAAALLPDPQAMLTIPFGKAIGVMGAALVGGRAELEHIVNSGREFIYSTAMPAAQAAAVSAAI